MGDVCDKGITTALFMALFRSLLRAFSQQDYSPHLVNNSDDEPKSGINLEGRPTFPSLGRLALKNAMELTNNFIVNNHASKDMFATIFFGILEPVSGMLIYINAGHESAVDLEPGKGESTIEADRFSGRIYARCKL